MISDYGFDTPMATQPKSGRLTWGLFCWEVEMRSLWGKAPFQFQLREVPMPEPDPGEVVVKVAACGICGTDVHFLRHNEDWTPLGHEVVGSIVAVGPYVTRWRGGEAVIVENHTGCGVCEQCKNGRALYCQNLTTYMNDRAGLADYLRVRADMVQAYETKALTPRQAALAEPLTVALDLLQRADPDLNDEVAVFGPGPIGLMLTRLARLVAGHLGAGHRAVLTSASVAAVSRREALAWLVRLAVVVAAFGTIHLGAGPVSCLAAGAKVAAVSRDLDGTHLIALDRGGRPPNLVIVGAATCRKQRGRCRPGSKESNETLHDDLLGSVVIAARS